jgi:CHAT domain-containing protein
VPGLPVPLREAVRRSLDLALSRLDAQLLAPLRVGGRRLVASCSGDLLFLPWGLLPSRLGVPTVLTPSAASWLQGRERARAPGPVVAAVAGPDLRLARSEAEAVAGVWPGSSLYVGDAATSAAACEALVGSDLVHVAAHGHHRQDSPLFSCVRLAGGPLYAYEIDPGAGLASCVVLSACEAGLATVRPGDESLGLSNVLVQLGAACVVAAVARVNDEVSAGFMRGVHEAMALGVDSATAVATATRATAESDAPPAYVCFGSW